MRTTALIGAEDFALIAQVLGPCELVKGEIVPMSPGGVRHSRVTGNAYALLDSHCRPLDTETASADPHVPGFACHVAAFFQD